MVNPVAQALQPLQPFIWGRGGAKLTPEQIAREREIAEALGVVDMSPVDHWLQGAARLANAAVGRLRESRADRAEQENNAYARRLLEQALSGGVGGSTVMTPALSGASPVDATAPAASSEPMDYASQRVAQAHAVGSGVLPPSFVAAIDRSEGGGGYDTLFSFANREGPFAGVDVSQMSIGDVMAFTDPSGPYAQFVKGKVGRVATPVGRHQIVGTTLRNAVQELGLDPSQPFDPATQDMIALHLAKKRVQSANTTEGKIAALRSEWEGFKSVPDDQMAQIVADIEAAPVNAAGPVSRQALQAQLESLPVGGTMTMPTPDQMATGSTQPSPVAMALAPQAAPPAPIQVAQAGGGINPAIIEALSSPYVNDQTRQIAALLLQQQIQAQQEAQAQQMRMLAAQQAGIDPRFAGDDEIWKAAVGQQFRAPTTDIQEYEYARQQGFPGSFTEFQEAKRRAGATSITNVLGGEELTPGQKKIDEAFADEYIRWVGGGFADSAKQLEQLNESLAILESGAPITGPGIGSVPEFAQPFINPDGVIAREQVEEVVQRNLREILGAQFTEREGERLISRAFNPRLSPQENAKRVRRLIAQIGEMAAAKQAMVDYFNEHGTLRGYQGRRPSLSQLEQIDFGDTPQPSSQKPISEMTDEELEAIINGNR